MSRLSLVVDEAQYLRLRQMMKERSPTDVLSFLEMINRTHQFIRRTNQRFESLFGEGGQAVAKSTTQIFEGASLWDLPSNTYRALAKEVAMVVRRRAQRVGKTHATEAVKDIAAGGRNWLLAEALGWANIVRHLETEHLDQRQHPGEGSAEFLCKFRDQYLFIAESGSEFGTGEIVMLRIGKPVSTCEQARAWLEGDDIDHPMFKLPFPKLFSIGRT